MLVSFNRLKDAGSPASRGGLIMFRRLIYSCFIVALAWSTLYAQSLSWTQWSKDPQHTGQINVVGQGLNSVVADLLYDPFVDIEKNPSNGDGDLFEIGRASCRERV